MGYYRAPNKSSVHRFAVLSLFRALLRGTRLANVPQDAQPMLRAAVKQRYRKNRETQKPSELEAAVLIGFRTLSILRSAPKNGSSRVDNLVETIKRVCPPPQSAYARKRRPIGEEKKELAEKGLSSQPVIWARKGAVRVLEDRPLPLEKLRGSGVRQVPKIATTTGIAFLRLKKPQSPFLSRMLRSKLRKHQRTIDRVRELEELEQDALAEDEWDQLLEDELRVARDGAPAKTNQIDRGDGSSVGSGNHEEDYNTDQPTWAKLATEELENKKASHEEFWRKIHVHNERVWEIYKAERELAAKEGEDRARSGKAAQDKTESERKEQ